MMLRAVLLALLGSAHLVSAQGSPAAPGYAVQFSTPAPGKAQGSVLVLDVGSLWKKHPTQPQQSVRDPGACQRRCADLPGCTAFAFCKDPKGCGTGCSAHAAKNPSVSAVALESQAVPNKRGERVEVSSGFKIPINSFGPYTPNSATKGCDGKAPNKWAFGTCTLLKGATGGKTAPPAEGAGWVSAWLQRPVPPQCGPLSAAACAACFATADSGACLSCMTDKRATSYIVDVALIADGTEEGSTGSRTLDQCITCARLANKEQQKQCVGCVLDNKPCGSCIAYPGAATQLALPSMGACMGCVEGKGKRFTGACLTCAASRDPAKCITCLGSFYPKLTCRTNAYEDCYKPDFDNPCATCQKVAPAAYDRCISCYERPRAKADCDNCALVPAAAAQQQCFACSAKVLGNSSASPGGCGACFSRSKAPDTLTQCLSCVTGANTAGPMRQHCGLCSSPELSEAQAGRCFKCLASKDAGTGCGSCSRAVGGSDAAFASCMACRNNPANGPDCRDCDSLGWGLPAAEAEALRKRCYDCVVASQLVVPQDAGSAPLGTCQACLSVKGADVGACLACNTNAKVPTVAKGWCVSCATAPPGGKRDACFACLAGNAKLANAGAFKQKCGV